MIEFHLIFSVDQNFLLNLAFDRNFCFLSVDRISLDLFSWSKVLIMVFWLLKSFDQVPKFASYFFGTWSKVLIMPKIPLLELSIKCQKRTYRFWQLIEFFDQVKSLNNLINWLWNFRSTEKWQFWSSDFRSNDPVSIISTPSHDFLLPSSNNKQKHESIP